MATASKKFWLTFPTRLQVEKPIIWQMSRKFPEVIFDIRQASIQHEIGIMAMLLTGEAEQVQSAMEFLKESGLQVDPIEKTILEG